MMRQSLKRRIRALEAQLGWRRWLARPMAVWPLYALEALNSETRVRPASLDELNTDQLVELLNALNDPESQ